MLIDKQTGLILFSNKNKEDLMVRYKEYEDSIKTFRTRKKYKILIKEYQKLLKEC